MARRPTCAAARPSLCSARILLVLEELDAARWERLDGVEDIVGAERYVLHARPVVIVHELLDRQCWRAVKELSRMRLCERSRLTSDLLLSTAMPSRAALPS
eukprot:Tamp_29878.p1 GENE.Tamp_29878~~Tamp_29878.p1  ORF type:complete len:101 (+),score=4.55 Tamp_29878:56-358(+)